jgi:AmmeMemoRadiSam system protein B
MNRLSFGRRGTASGDVRPSPIAGQWYPGAPDLLRDRVQAFLDAAEVELLDGRPVALVAPHAGHIYSGGVAAHAYWLVQGAHHDVVAIVAPNHRIANYAPYLTTAHAAYWTPLGEVPLAGDLVAALDTRLGLSRVRRDEEHSLEIQIPFLQVALADEFRLLPVMLNDQSREACYVLGEALADLLRDQNSLLVASTDLSHFVDAETAADLDGAVTDRIAAFDPEGLLDVLETGKGRACGGGPTVAVMLAARALGADRAELLKYATSGDVTGDYHSVVGYAAAALYKEAKKTDG